MVPGFGTLVGGSLDSCSCLRFGLLDFQTSYRQTAPKKKGALSYTLHWKIGEY
ncbi:Uncharacterized protein TCM_036865 [Theobroma cacao]|uniref:Uncharacterized protein n=1 Tax=Theobroma cacao TaxID=3641 RepID=A0A061GHF4_THECC|nr:Uncharacterized protein TCM_036865 [Theobroma cacao]